ncbi:MAG: hypothetical protein U0793_07735 [Gemmataceae bacterium]
MAIPIARIVYASAVGSAAKIVSCETCGKKYVYEVRRLSQGQAIHLISSEGEGAKALAQRIAAHDLKKQLDAAIEVVPCPACGWIQADMLPTARRRHLRRVKILGIFILLGLVLPLVMTVGAVFWPPNARAAEEIVDESILWAAGLLAVGAGILIWRAMACKHYDPNGEDLDKRLAEGRQRGQLLVGD